MLLKKWKIRIGALTEKEKRNKEFRKLFLGISAGLLVIVLTGMFTLYTIMQNLIIRQNAQMSTQAFTQVQKEFEKINETAKVIATQVLLDDVCAVLLESSSSQWPDSLAIDQVRSQLTMYQTANPIVESIYIYNEVPNLILSSGSRFGSVKLEDFLDENIVDVIKEPEKYGNGSFRLREKSGAYIYLNEPESTKVYSYVLYANHNRTAIIINLDYEEIQNTILSMDIMTASRMSVINDKNERLVDIQTVPIEETEELRQVVLEMAENGDENREVTMGNGEKYFISYLYSEEGGWNYVKVTRWATIFGILITMREWTVAIIVVIVAAMLFVVGKTSVQLLRFQTKIQKRYNPGIRRAELNELKESFLSDFLHSRKLFLKNQLREQMERFNFDISENKKYTVLILKLEEPERFKELYGKKGTYDIEFGYWNIFEEIYGKYFKISGIINPNHTLTFLLQTTGVEHVQEQLQKCFEEFCKAEMRFIQWKFFCVGTEQEVNLEDIPELNEKLKSVLKSSFFYPYDTYCTMEQYLTEHSERMDFQKLEVDSLMKAVRSGDKMKETYTKLTNTLNGCTTTDYMNTVMWLGITMMREIDQITVKEEEINRFLLMLAKCEKKSDVEVCFLQFFDLIAENHGIADVKKGMAGRLDEVKKYLKENFSDPNLSLERLADEFGGSPNYLGRIFKKDTGISVSEYINELRLEEVKRELRETNRAAKEIAECYGFVSSNYFYTYFRKKMGYSPQTYRMQYKEYKKENEEKE